MKILYMVMGDLNRVDSGSGLRPNCMYRAFLERGHEVYALSGYQNRQQGKERKIEVEKAMAWVRENHPDLCYIESSTYPIIHSCDYAMLRFLKEQGVPSAYFYRDVYRLYPDLFPRRKGFSNKLKDFYIDLMQHRTDRALRQLNVIYFPAKGYADHFDYRDKRLLPPAGAVEFLPEHPNYKTCIYVGGVTDFYGYPLMMEAFSILNRDSVQYKLILVCREGEYERASAGKEKPEWLEVYHASGKDLIPLYAKADIGLLALGYNAYSNLCIGIKLFQYVGYGLPVLSTNVQTMGKLIRENGFGELTEPNPKDYAEAIRRMLSDDEKLRSYRTTMAESMRQRHLWVHRVDQIVADLTGGKQ